MSTFTTRDGTRIYYKDWGSGPVVVFSHGWPLSSDAWDAQLLFLVERGYRVIAHDRRGHGRSDQPSEGNDMDTFADDLAELIESLDLRDITLVGHSTGGGEVARYIGRHGTSRVARVVLLGAVPPQMIRSDSNPEGVPEEVVDQIREGVRRDRSQYFRDLAIPFFSANRQDARVSQGVLDQFWRLCMQAGIKATYDCIAQFSETDFTEDLRRFDIPTLVAHGDDDQIVPYRATALRAAELIPNATLRIYPGGPHGIAVTDPDLFNEDLLSFIETGAVRRAEEAAPTFH